MSAPPPLLEPLLSVAVRSGDGGRDGGERVVDGAVPLAKRLPRRPGRVPRVGPEKVPSHEPREKVRELLPGVRVERVEDTELPELKMTGKNQEASSGHCGGFLIIMATAVWEKRAPTGGMRSRLLAIEEMSEASSANRRLPHSLCRGVHFENSIIRALNRAPLPKTIRGDVRLDSGERPIVAVPRQESTDKNRPHAPEMKSGTARRRTRNHPGAAESIVLRPRDRRTKVPRPCLHFPRSKSRQRVYEPCRLPLKRL